MKKPVWKFKESDQFLRFITDRVPAFISYMSADGRYRFVNKAYSEWFERSPAEIEGKTRADLMGDAPGQDILGAHAKRALSGEDAPFEFTLKKANGQSRDISGAYLSDVDPASGEVRGFIGVAHDITEQVEARRKAEESEKRYRSLTEALPQMIWTATPDGKVTYANQRCLTYTGMASHEKYGEGWVSTIHPEDIGFVGAAWTKSTQNNSEFKEEYRIKDGTGNYHWFLGRAVPVKNDAGEVQYWIGTATDIEEQKDTIEKLQAERTLREHFVATLSHDLRNPLSAAKMSAQMLGRAIQDPSRMPTLVGRLVDSINRADQMISNLLDANRVKAGERLPIDVEPVDANLLIHETLEELSSVHGKRFVLKTTATAQGMWSKDGMRRIVENLCTNAVKYGDPLKPITVSITRAGDSVTLAVNNKGNPLHGDDLHRLFEPFHRSKAAQSAGTKGWGLGLTLVRGLTDAHGGNVRVESTAEHGTTFSVNLPLDARATNGGLA